MCRKIRRQKVVDEQVVGLYADTHERQESSDNFRLIIAMMEASCCLMPVRFINLQAARRSFVMLFVDRGSEIPWPTLLTNRGLDDNARKGGPVVGVNMVTCINSKDGKTSRACGLLDRVLSSTDHHIHVWAQFAAETNVKEASESPGAGRSTVQVVQLSIRK